MQNDAPRDLDDKYDAAVFRFLEMTVSFTARHLSARLDALLMVANHILCDRDQPFYSFSSCASSDEMDGDGDGSDDDDVSLSTVFEDCDLMCCAKFADTSQVSLSPPPTSQASSPLSLGTQVGALDRTRALR